MVAIKLNNNLFTLQSDGKFVYTDTIWDDLRVPLNAFKLGGLSDPGWGKIADNGAGSQGIYAWLFDDTAEEELFFAAQMPHGWVLESTIHPHVHMLPLTANAGNISFGLEYAVINTAGVLGNTSIVVGTQAAAGVALTNQFMELTDISMTGSIISAMIICRLFRNVGGADTHTGDVALLEFDFHYEKDASGSAQELVK